MFDPFGDFSKRGYLRNHVAAKQSKRVKKFEHAEFLLNVGEAVAYLEKTDTYIGYEDVKAVHKMLFGGFYPWAGQDRLDLDVSPNTKRGRVEFEHNKLAKSSMVTALQRANDPDDMASNPGEILGWMAYAHPFLDGNGRTLLTIHGELCRRAGFSINWTLSDKEEYLEALTKEIEHPAGRHLDTYLEPLRAEAQSIEAMVRTYRALPGLGPENKKANAPNPLGVDETPSRAFGRRHRP